MKPLFQTVFLRVILGTQLISETQKSKQTFITKQI